MANKIDQIKVGSTTYDIVPNAVDNRDYKASCPTLTSDTTLEVQSNKTTIINSSSTDSQYPSAKAVYDVLPKLSGTASAADVRKGKTFYKDSAVAQTGTMPDSSLSVSSTALTVSPAVTPTAVASATGNISLTAASTKPSSGYYIAATGGNSKTTGSSTTGSSSTVSTTAGYIAASSKSITSSAIATANASSKTAYYAVPEASFNEGFKYFDDQSKYSTYLVTSPGYSVEDKITSFELKDGEKLYEYICSGNTYNIDIRESGSVYRLDNSSTIGYFNNNSNSDNSNYIDYLNNSSIIKNFTNHTADNVTGYINGFFNGTSEDDPGKIYRFYNYGQTDLIISTGTINNLYNGDLQNTIGGQIGTFYNYSKSITKNLVNFGAISKLTNEGGAITTINNGVSMSGTIGTLNNGTSNKTGNAIQTLNNYSGNSILNLVNYGDIISMTNPGTISILTINGGKITHLSAGPATAAIDYMEGTTGGSFLINTVTADTNIVSHSGTMTVRGNAGTVTIWTNTKNIDIQANTGTVKYISWTIKQNSNGNITFSK